MAKSRMQFIRRAILALLVFAMLVAAAQAIRLHRMLQYIWYDHLAAVELVRRECAANPDVPVTGPAAFSLQKGGLVIAVSPRIRGDVLEGVEARVFRSFRGRLESVTVFSPQEWAKPGRLDRPPSPQALAQMGGLFFWQAVAVRTGGQSAYDRVVDMPQSPLPLE